MVLDPKYDPFDGSDLVKVLVKDGLVDLADGILDQQTSDYKNSAEGIFFKAKILGMERKWKPFIKLAENLENPELDEYKILAYSELSEWEKCSQINDHSIVQIIPIKYNCALKSKNPELAFKILKSAPKDSNLIKMKIIFLLDYGFVEEAKENLFVKSVYLNDTDLFLVLDHFKEKGLYKDLLISLQFLKIIYPNNSDLLLYFAQISFSQGLKHAAADAFSEASISRPSFAFHAAELLRDLKKFQRSQFMQFFIPEEKELLRQKMALWLDQEKFREISSLKRMLPRSEMKNDDDANYSLAYSLMKTGQTEEVVRFLNKITKAEILPKATALQKIWESCQSVTHNCRI